MPTSSPPSPRLEVAKLFLDNLKQSRLLSEEQLGQVARLAEETPAEDLPLALISDGILTPLQAHCVANGDVRSLVLGPYHLLEEIGRGGMGRVYKALHTVMGRIVALKVMAPELADNERPREQFLREVRSVTRLNHPNIVLAHDANEVDGVLFLVMEYVEGTTLAELVRVGGPLPVNRACELMRQAAMGLQHAYQKGLVHRDIKPANLLLPRATAADTPTGGLGAGPVVSQPSVLVKIADFGLARLLGGDTVGAHTSTGFLGTPDYVAPEQCQDGRSADIRSDLYSLGCSFHFALTGRVPFAGDSVMEKLFAHVMTPAPAVETLRPDVPREVAGIIARLMVKNPDERFQTPAQLALALAPWCVDGGAGLARGRVTDELPAAGSKAGEATRAMDHEPKPRRETDVALRVIPAAAPKAGETTSALEQVPKPGRRETDVALPAVTRVMEQHLSALAPSAGRARAPLTWDTHPDLAFAPLSPTCSLSDVSLPTTLETDSPAPSRESLRHSWASWSAVIDDIAQRPRHAPCSEEEYQELYRGLLEECAAHAGRAGAEDRARLEQLAELIRPWMSLKVLARTEPLLLQDLAGRVREAGRGLGLEEASGGWVVWLVGFALLAGAFPLAVQALGLQSLRPLSTLPGGVWGVGAVAGAVVLLAAWLLAPRRK